MVLGLIESFIFSYDEKRSSCSGVSPNSDTKSANSDNSNLLNTKESQQCNTCCKFNNASIRSATESEHASIAELSQHYLLNINFFNIFPMMMSVRAEKMMI